MSHATIQVTPVTPASAPKSPASTAPRRPHSVTFWDNRAVQHVAMWGYFPQTRLRYRVTLNGNRPV
jgi:hypothetical protein